MQRENFKERTKHGTAELPIGVHHLSFPEGTDNLFYLHWHSELEFFVLTEGAIIFTIENTSYELEPGDCVFINPNLCHSAKTISGAACSFFAIDFLPQFFQEDLSDRFARNYLLPIMSGQLVIPSLIKHESVPAALWQSQVVHYLEDMSLCPDDNPASYELLLKSSLLGIWHLLFSYAIKKQKKENSAETSQIIRLKPVLQFIHANYSEEITLSELAALLPMSEGQFCRVFKNAMKCSPVQYLMRYRIIQSCHFLLDAEKKISEIANLSGFNNVSYYNKLFLQIIGCTPGQYRLNEKKRSF